MACAGRLDLTKVSGCYALVWKYSECEELQKLTTKVQIRGSLPMEHLTMML
jgi:hypothetical protein